MEFHRSRRYALDFDADGAIVTMTAGASLPAWWDAPGWEIQQGARLYLPIRVYDATSTAIDLSGYTARLKVKQTYDATTTLISLTSGSGITMAATEPQIIVDVAGTSTDDYDFTRGVFDLEIVSASSVVTSLIAGYAVLRREATT